MENTNFISIEQSKELQELGVLNISMFKYRKDGKIFCLQDCLPWKSDGRFIMAFSYGELLELCTHVGYHAGLPKDINGAFDMLKKRISMPLYLQQVNEYLNSKIN